MRSHEVLRKAADTVGVKSLAGTLRLSPALVYKWCQEWDPNDPDASGARNPLDRLKDIVDATGDVDVINWLCGQADGFFTRNSRDLTSDMGTELVRTTQRLVNEFSQLLLTVTKSIEDDGEIEPAEAERIRDTWELFKRTVESFTVACENGVYYSKKE